MTRNGLFSSAKGLLTIEEHGANKQYVKFRYWGKYSFSGLFLIASLIAITLAAVVDKSWVVTAVLSILTALVTLKYLLDSASVVNCIVSGFEGLSVNKEKESKLNVAAILFDQNLNEEEEISLETFEDNYISKRLFNNKASKI